MGGNLHVQSGILIIMKSRYWFNVFTNKHYKLVQIDSLKLADIKQINMPYL